MAGARLFLFNGGTTQPRTGYKDSSLTSPHPNPIVADNQGRLPLIYLDDGFYRQRLMTKTATQIFDDDGIPVLSSTSGGSGTSVDPDSFYRTRDIKIRFDDQLLGWVRPAQRANDRIGLVRSNRARKRGYASLYEELWSYSNISVAGGRGACPATSSRGRRAASVCAVNKE